MSGLTRNARRVWKCSCGAAHVVDDRSTAEYTAWLELAWDQVLGRFGGVLSELNRHDGRVVRARRGVCGHVCASCRTFEGRQAQQRRVLAEAANREAA